MNIPEMFGYNVFNDREMKKRLSKEIYDSLTNTIGQHMELDINIANEVANAMKEWAIERGATHYTHWFQPMTGITAEKHDGFITPQADGSVIMEFCGKELIKGESDASSFPSGGIRATFEARGYTAWDPTSYAFIKDDSLCIPTVFCSYTGDMLDNKTPLLKSIDLVSKESLRLLKLLGYSDVNCVNATVGAEQEYFLVDKHLYEQRKDLIFTGRTLFGAPAPKGQEMDDHYFGALNTRVKNYMKELDEELWKLGVYAKTEHNEAAPAQHELAPVYCATNIAIDHNQITMELMKKIANKHGLVCLLHEKPFKGVNGSGKHNNWSLATDTGINLFKPGKKPYENKLFLIFLAAVIKAVDEHQDLLRYSVASPANDHRLGGNEAPPSIVSMYLGREIEDIVECISKGVEYESTAVSKLHTGVDVLPDFKMDTADRNRTSPFAFTGNKFEFRMPGSSMSVSTVNMVLNTITADVLSGFSARLENCDNVENEVNSILRDTFTAHKRIIFSGNNYSKEWVEEAKKRGLLNLKTTVDAIPSICDPKNVELFTRHKVFTEKELLARAEIAYDNYSKTINIEAKTMIDMASKDILPAAIEYCSFLENTLNTKNKLKMFTKNDAVFKIHNQTLLLYNELYDNIEKLKYDLIVTKSIKNVSERANEFCFTVLEDMNKLRQTADSLELVVPASYWPYPVYSELMFSIY